MLPTELTSAAATTDPGSAREPSAAEVGQQEFLRMLIAQLENQDPLSPQDPTQFTAQLAQFSSLEQLLAMRTAIEGLTLSQGAAGERSTREAALGLIGRDVLASSSELELGSGAPPPIRLDLVGAAERVTIDLLDANGVRVRRLELENLPSGLSEVAWDGHDAFDRPLQAGVYGLRVSAQAGDAAVVANTLTRGRVDAISLEPGSSPVLHLGARVVRFDDVREVRELAR